MMLLAVLMNSLLMAVVVEATTVDQVVPGEQRDTAVLEMSC